MREIIFRAWDKKQKKMIYNGDVWYPYLKKSFNREIYSVTVTNKGILYWKLSDNNEDYIVLKTENSNKNFYKNWDYQELYTRDIDVMPGIKINEQNIFAGDIIKTENGDLFEITFGNIKNIGQYGIDYKPAFYAYRLGTDDGCLLFDGFGDSFEVIGNIYENPELLEVKNERD